MPFNHVSGHIAGRISHLRRAGLGRAAYWRALGFPNCARARAAKARYRLERLKREEWELAKTVNPYSFPEDAELWASVARDQGKPVVNKRSRPARESLVAEIKRARAAAAQAPQPVRKDILYKRDGPRGF